MFESEIESILEFLQEKKDILITTHNMVDLDALSSCFAFKSFLAHHFPNKTVEILFFDLSKHVKEFMNKFLNLFTSFDFSYQIHAHIDIKAFDALILLDTNDISFTLSKQEQEAIKESSIPLIIIDHHYSEQALSERTPVAIISDETASTAELIFEFFEKVKYRLNTELRYLLLSGILTDTGHFKYADNHSIKRVSKLLSDLPKDAFQEILELIKSEKDISERIALIKGLQRAELHRCKDWLIAISHVSSYEGAVASKLVKNGFDISIVYSTGKDEDRISTRANKYVIEKTSLHLGKIASEYGKELGADGGGHDGAAGLNGTFDPKNASKDLLNKIIEILND